MAEHAQVEPAAFQAKVRRLRHKPHVKARLLRLHAKVYEGGTA